MSDNNTYYRRNKEILKEQALNCYHQQTYKGRAQEYYENNKENFQ